MKKYITAASMALMLATATDIKAQQAGDLEDLTFAQMLKSVDLSKDGKAVDLIRRFQDAEAKSKLLNGPLSPKRGECTIEFMRNKEVTVITIPAHDLFDPNSTTLKKGAETYLNPIKRYMKNPDMFRVLLVMHTDNTGSEQYRDELTADRVDAVMDWFDEHGADTSFTFPYAFGDETPILPNTSVDNRDRNRRLEVYLMPGTKMLEEAKKGKIDF